MMAVALACVLAIQGSDAWEEWHVISSEVKGDARIGGWRLPAAAEEFRAEHPIPGVFSEAHPFVGGKLVILRGADIEAWDLEAKRLAWKAASPSGTLGWKLNRNRIYDITPRGPADRAGLRVGDGIAAVGGKEIEPWRSNDLRPRAGEKIEFEAECAGGRRKFSIVAEPPVRPYGNKPEFLGIVGDDLLVQRDDGVDQISGADGHVVWTSRGGYLAHGGGLVLLTDYKREVRAVATATGKVAWTHRVPEGERPGDAYWTEAGPIVSRGTWTHQGKDLTMILLNPADGTPAWTFARRMAELDGVIPLGGDRLFVVMRSPWCDSRSPMGGVPTHFAPTCKIYRILKASNGEQLWWAKTGGRAHGGSHRMAAPTYIPFDPFKTGPATIARGRLLWYDLDAEALTVIDPATMKEERKVTVRGGEDFLPWHPAGRFAVATTGGIALVGETTIFVPVNGEDVEEAAFSADGKLAFFKLRSDQEFRMVAYDVGRQPTAELWSKEFKGFWDSFTRCGDRILVRTRQDDRAHEATDTYAWLDAATGKELWTTSFDNPPFCHRRGSAYHLTGAVVEGRFMMAESSGGLRVYRRSDD